MPHSPPPMTTVNQGAPPWRRPPPRALPRRAPAGAASLLLALLALLLHGCPDRAAGTDAPSPDAADVAPNDLADDRATPDVADAAAPDAPDAADARDAADVRDAPPDVRDAAPDVDAFMACPLDVPPPDVPPADAAPFVPIDATTPLSDAGDGPAPPRLIAPSHALGTTSQRPTLQWELPAGVTGARIELCHDRACTRVLGTIDADGTRVRPPTALPPGVVFWRARPITAAGVGTRMSATWEFVAPRRESGTDTFFGIMKDFNRDGFDDVVISSPRYCRSAESCSGAFHVYYGSAGGLHPCPDFTGEGGPLPRGLLAYFGRSLAAAGDINGDGYADLIVGGQYTNVARVYLGSPSGLPPTASQEVVETSRFGNWGDVVRAVGDVNGDGFSDAFLGDLDRGYIYLGSPTGLAAQPEPYNTCDRNAAAAQDANGDGYGDFLCRGLYLGSPTGLSPDRRLRVMGGAASDRGILTVGDLNGDRYADWVLAAGGLVQYYFGGTPPSDRPVRTLYDVDFSASVSWRMGWPGGWGFGDSVGTPTDLNGDGYADLLVAYAEADATLVFFGRADGRITEPGLIYRGDGTGALGSGLAGVGDFDGDGYGDVVIGDSTTHFADHLDRALVFRGGPTPSATPSQILMSPFTPTYSDFGLWVAARTPWDALRTPRLIPHPPWEDSSWQRSARSIASSM